MSVQFKVVSTEPLAETELVMQCIPEFLKEAEGSEQKGWTHFTVTFEGRL